jgi:hypothetical protein
MNWHYPDQGKGGLMMMTEIGMTDQMQTRQQDALSPQIENWRRKLERTCRHLLPWACSAQMLPMWVSDYSKVCKLASALNAKIDELFSLTADQLPDDSAGNALIVAAIDVTVDEIGQIGRRIENELHNSVGVPQQHHRRNRADFHRHRASICFS